MNDHVTGRCLNPLITGVWLLQWLIISYYLNLLAKFFLQGFCVHGWLRAIVHNNDLPVMERLIPNAGQGFAEHAGSIVGWNDD